MHVYGYKSGLTDTPETKDGIAHLFFSDGKRGAFSGTGINIDYFIFLKKFNVSHMRDNV